MPARGLSDAVRLLHGRAHALVRGREFELRAQGLEQITALQAHGFRHGKHATQAAHGRDQGHADAHIAAGGLHQHAAGLQFAVFQGALNQIKGHAILDGAAGIAVFQLQPDRARQLAGKVQTKHGRIADGL